MVGIYQEARNSAVAVDTASILISPSRNRSEIVITNTGATNITLSFGTPSADKVGVYLLPYAAYYATNAVGFNVFPGEIFAVGDGAGGTIAVFER